MFLHWHDKAVQGEAALPFSSSKSHQEPGFALGLTQTKQRSLTFTDYWQLRSVIGLVSKRIGENHMKTKPAGIAGKTRRVRRLVGTQGQQGTDQHTLQCQNLTQGKLPGLMVHVYTPSTALGQHRHKASPAPPLLTSKDTEPFMRHQNQHLLGTLHLGTAHC